jgi:hypothetical protein
MTFSDENRFYGPLTKVGTDNNKLPFAEIGAPDKPCGENVRMLTQKLSLNDTRLKKS